MPPTYYPQTVFFNRGPAKTSTTTSAPTRARPRSTQDIDDYALRMSGTAEHLRRARRPREVEIRRVHSERSCDPRAPLRGVLRRAGGARARGARRPRPRGRCTWSRCAATRCSPPAGSLIVGTTAQFSRLAVRERRAGGGSPPRCSRPPTRRPAPAAARRLVLHAQTYARVAVRGARLQAPRPRVHRGRDRAHRDGEAPVSARRRMRVDPLTGQRRSIAGDRLAVPAASRASSPGTRSTASRSVRRGSRGPDAARALRRRPAADRRRPGWSPRGAEPVPGPDADPTPRARGQPRPVLGRARRAAPTR